jgi:hypothetical protein
MGLDLSTTWSHPLSIFNFCTFSLPASILPYWSAIWTQGDRFSPVFGWRKYTLSCNSNKNMLFQCSNLFDFNDSYLVRGKCLLFDTIIARGIMKIVESYFSASRNWCGLKKIAMRVIGMLKKLVIFGKLFIYLTSDIPCLYILGYTF